MAENKLHNLDEGVEESFTFQLLGHKYIFRHLNTEEIEKLQSFKEDDKESNKEMKQYIFQFVSKVDKDAPEFPETTKKMLTPHWKRFLEMIKVEFGG